MIRENAVELGPTQRLSPGYESSLGSERDLSAESFEEVSGKR